MMPPTLKEGILQEQEELIIRQVQSLIDIVGILRVPVWQSEDFDLALRHLGQAMVHLRLAFGAKRLLRQKRGPKRAHPTDSHAESDRARHHP